MENILKKNGFGKISPYLLNEANILIFGLNVNLTKKFEQHNRFAYFSETIWVLFFNSSLPILLIIKFLNNFSQTVK